MEDGIFGIKECNSLWFGIDDDFAGVIVARHTNDVAMAWMWLSVGC